MILMESNTTRARDLRHKTIIFCSALLFSGYGMAQGTARTTVLPNGVVSHEAVGVEGLVEKTTETPTHENGYMYWNEVQCMEAIDYIRVKSQSGCSVKEASSYEEQIREIEQRLNEIRSKKN